MKSKTNRMMVMVAVCLVAAIAITTDVLAAVSIPNSFSAGTQISSAAMNANFSAMAAQMPAAKTVPATNGYSLSASYTQIGSISVTVPTGGSIILMASGWLSNSGKVVGSYSSAYIGLSTVNNALQSYYTRMAWGANSSYDWYEMPWSVQGTMVVSAAGTYTYYLVGANNGASASSTVWRPYITAIFVPNNLP